MGMFGGLFPNVAPTDPTQPGEDPSQSDGLIASRIVETLGNVRAASQAQGQQAAQEAAKQPGPTRTITEKPDGTLDISYKNVPKQTPGDAVKQASAGPHYDWLQQVVGELDRGAQQLPRPTGSDIDQKLADPKGRADLLSEVGIERPHFGGNGGLLAWAGKADAYDELLKNPEKIKRLVVMSRMQGLQKGAEMSSPLEGQIEGAQSRDRQNVAEDRRQGEASRRDYNAFIETLHKFDLARDTSADDAVKFSKDLANRLGVEWDDSLESITRHKWATDQAAQSKAQAEDQRKKLFDQRQEAKTDMERERLDVQIRNLDSLISTRENKKTKIRYSEAVNATASELSDVMNDDSIDEQSKSSALRYKSEALDTEERKLTSERNAKRALVAAIRDKPAADNSDPEKSAVAQARIGEINSRLADIRNERTTVNALKAKRKVVAPGTAAGAPSAGKPSGVLVNQGGQLVYQRQ